MVSLIVYGMKKKSIKSVPENVVLGWIIVLFSIIIFIIIMTVLKE